MKNGTADAIAEIVKEAAAVLAGLSADDNRELVAQVVEKVLKPICDETIKVIYSEDYEKAWLGHVERLCNGLVQRSFSREEALTLVLEKVAAEHAALRTASKNIGMVGRSK